MWCDGIAPHADKSHHKLLSSRSCLKAQSIYQSIVYLIIFYACFCSQSMMMMMEKWWNEEEEEEEEELEDRRESREGRGGGR